VGVQHGRVNRTTLCNKSEKWKSPDAKKGVPNFETPNSLAIPKNQLPRDSAPRKAKAALLFLLHRNLHLHDHFAVQLHRNLVLAHHLDRLGQHNLLPVNLKALARQRFGHIQRRH
jgi:hypothetical protein